MVVGTFGGEGEGPGELTRPVVLVFGSSHVSVLDAGSSRVQYYDPDGTPAGHFDIGRHILVPAALNGRGDIAAPTMGYDSALAVILEDSARTARYVGSPIADPPKGIDLAGLRTQALRGEIPREFRNNVLPILGENGECVLVLQAVGEVRFFDSGGRNLWSRMLPERIIASAREAYLALASGEVRPVGVPQPRVVAAGRFVDGQIWLMLASGADRANSVLILDAATGETLRRLELNLTGAGPFAVDVAAKRLYVVVPDEGLVVAGSLENVFP